MHASHGPGHLAGIMGMEKPSGLAFLHEVRSASRSLGDKDRQPAGHGLIDHEPPALGDAGQHKTGSTGIEIGQLGLLDQPTESNVRLDLLGHAAGNPAQSFFTRPTPAYYEIPRRRAAAEEPDVSLVGRQEALQVLFLDDPAHIEEITGRQSPPLAHL